MHGEIFGPYQLELRKRKTPNVQWSLTATINNSKQPLLFFFVRLNSTACCHTIFLFTFRLVSHPTFTLSHFLANNVFHTLERRTWLVLFFPHTDLFGSSVSH